MNDQPTIAKIRMQALQPHLAEAAASWAARLQLPLDGDSEFALQLGEGGLQLVELGPQAPGPVRVDFVEGAAAHRPRRSRFRARRARRAERPGPRTGLRYGGPLCAWA